MDDKRGRLSGFDLMPSEAGHIVVWAAQELADRKRTQTDIYAEFAQKCRELMAEYRGELEFQIPAFSSFNRFSMRKAKANRMMTDAVQLTAVLAANYDHKTADEITIIATEMGKAAAMAMLADRGDTLNAKELKALSDALKSLQAAQNLSADRRAEQDAMVEKKLTEAVDLVAKAKGLSAETAEQIKSEILGVTK